jgi:hypothetical protein
LRQTICWHLRRSRPEKVPLHFREYACGLFKPVAGISQRLIHFVPKDDWPRLLVGVKDPGGLFERLVNVSMLD